MLDYEFADATPVDPGTFATVYRATHKTTGDTVAIKCLKGEIPADARKFFIRELAILINQRHPATLPVLGFAFSPAKGRFERGPVIMTPLMPQGSMEDLLKAPPPEWNATTKSKCVFGVAAGMAYMHGHDVIHGDLTPENVLFDENWDPVVADFGLSVCWAGETLRPFVLGSLLATAPELFADPRPEAREPSSDVYAFGVLLYMMFAADRTPNFADGAPAKDVSAVMERTVHGMRFERLPNIPRYYWAVIERCWSHTPADRPTFEGLVEEFRSRHLYALAGADTDELVRYERAITEPDTGEVVPPSPRPIENPPPPVGKAPNPPAPSRRYLWWVLVILIPIALAFLVNYRR
jgi:serine/threonine protein kinase